MRLGRILALPLAGAAFVAAVTIGSAGDTPKNALGNGDTVKNPSRQARVLALDVEFYVESLAGDAYVNE